MRRDVSLVVHDTIHTHIATISGASKSSGSARATVKPAPPTTSVGYPVTHSCTVQIGPTGDKGVIHAEVVRGGEVIADGMGDNVVDALLGLIEYMLPPDDPEYPGQLGGAS